MFYTFRRTKNFLYFYTKTIDKVSDKRYNIDKG